MSDAYGELIKNDTGIELALPVANAFVKWTDFDAGNAGPVDLVEVDAPNAELVIGANGEGVYDATMIYVGKGSSQRVITTALFLNGVRQLDIQTIRPIGGETDNPEPALGVFRELIAVVPGDVLDIRFASDKNNSLITLTHMGFTLEAVVRSTS